MKTAKVLLGDDKEYTITEFDVGDFIKIEEKYGSINLTEGKIEPIMYWTWLALRKSNKNLTLEQFYSLIPASYVTDGKGISGLFETLSKLNGWDKKETPSKNAPSPVEEK